MSYMSGYVESIIDKTGLESEDELTLVILYALLAKTKQATVTAEDVHDAWSLWTEYGRNNKGHHSLIPFNELETEIQNMDDEYVDAIQLTFQEMRQHG